MIFPNISIGRNTKRYTHNMSFDNNTTLPFGVVQPLMSQRLEPNAKISVNMRQLVRLAPMPVPTFARLNMVNEVCFVPTVDVCPYYEAFVSQLSYTVGSTTFYPTQLPQTDNNLLLLYLLCTPYLSYWTAYSPAGVAYASVDANTVTSLNTQLRASMGVSSKYITSSTLGLSSSAYVADIKNNAFVTPDGADFFFQTENGGCVCFRFTAKGRRFRSNLLGLGYSLNPSDSSPVSLIPMLSYYKAWFDLYYPVRDLTWTDSKAFALIEQIDRYIYDFTITNVTLANFAFLKSFFEEFCSTFFVANDDIVSVHRSTPSLTSNKQPPKFVDYDGKSKQPFGFVSGSWPYLQTDSSSSATNFGLVTLQALQRFSRYFAKNSVIGKRISSYLKVHYGAAVANSLYKDANHIGKYSYPLSVDDVLSSSDTFDVSTDTAGNSKSSGELLGSYAGKGIGFDKSSFDFTAPTFGYFFVLSSVSTPSGYFQGNNGDLYVTDFDHVPNPDFDALGFEISPRGQFIGSNDVLPYSANVDLPANIGFKRGFGFVPRYSGLKYHKNIVNGDISRRSTSSSLSAYHLNRIITPFVASQTSLDTSSGKITAPYTLKSAAVPSADTSWRYLSKDDYLGNYDRIFYNSSLLALHSFNASDSSWLSDFSVNVGPDDNFIVQTVFDVRVTDQYKPLSQAWDTYEESTDDSSVDVKPE